MHTVLLNTLLCSKIHAGGHRLPIIMWGSVSPLWESMKPRCNNSSTNPWSSMQPAVSQAGSYLLCSCSTFEQSRAAEPPHPTEDVHTWTCTERPALCFGTLHQTSPTILPIVLPGGPAYDFIWLTLSSCFCGKLLCHFSCQFQTLYVLYWLRRLCVSQSSGDVKLAVRYFYLAPNICSEEPWCRQTCRHEGSREGYCTWWLSNSLSK